jgi:hypothetical protein
MALWFFFSSVRRCLKLPTALPLTFSGQKKATAVLGGTAVAPTGSVVVMMTNRSPLGSQAKLITVSLIVSTTSTGTPFSLTRKISSVVAIDFLDLECRSTLTQMYDASDCQWSLASETLNRLRDRTICLDGMLIKPTLAGLLPISGVQKQKSCSYSLTPSRRGLAGAHSKSITPSSLIAVLSRRFIFGSSYTEIEVP